MATTLKDLVGRSPPLQRSSTPEEAEAHSCLPGQNDPSEHVLERLFPTGRINLNPRKVRELWKAGEISEREVREYQAFSGEQVLPTRADGQPLPDRGGETQPYTGALEDGQMPESTPATRAKRFPIIEVDS